MALFKVVKKNLDPEGKNMDISGRGQIRYILTSRCRPTVCVYYLLLLVFPVRSWRVAVKKIPILVPDHIYVPKHEIMSKKEAEQVLERYNCKPTELPLIFVSDPAIIGLGVKPGDMIRITRKSSTAGEGIYYRYVVEV